MKAESKEWVQIILAVAILAAGVRLVLILRSRRQDKAARVAQAAPPLNPNYYVVPKKLYPYDLKSAKQLTEQPVWVKEGYRYTYYPYEHGHVDFKREAGTLGPLEKLSIKNVITAMAPNGQRQVLAVFDKEENTYAVPTGTVTGSDYHIYSDEMFFIQDPRQLYRFWPAEIWQAIEKHEVKPGMDELQTDFAVGMGVPERQEDAAIKTVKYPNGGKPLQVTFRDGKAVTVKPGSSSG